MAAMQKRLAGQILKCSPNNIKFDPERLEEIKGAITKHDVRNLIKDHALFAQPIQGVSRGRAKEHHLQTRKGRQRGVGSRKGKKNARRSEKRVWIDKIRGQKALLMELREKKIVTHQMYRQMYLKAKGGYFRSIRHIKLYLNEQLKQ